MIRARMMIGIGSMLAALVVAATALPIVAKAAELARPETETVEPKTVTARFKVGRIGLLPFSVRSAEGGYETKVCRSIEMAPVTSGDYFTATPSGKLEMIVANESAAEAFELGAEYILTFEKVSDGTPVILQKPPEKIA